MAGRTDDNEEHGIEEALQQFVNAQLQGQEPDTDEFVKKYPELEDQLRERIGKLERIDTLLDSIVQADESDYGTTVMLPDLAGRKIGSFEIGEMIGRGGMGVVHLARDTKLDRSVAIKTMPVDLMGDSAARMRFKREAKLLASLNHPNIAVIYDIIEQDAGSAYLVLEYVPGPTLADRIAHKPMKLRDVLPSGAPRPQAGQHQDYSRGQSQSPGFRPGQDDRHSGRRTGHDRNPTRPHSRYAGIYEPGICAW
jgi:hypothetical protein